MSVCESVCVCVRQRVRTVAPITSRYYGIGIKITGLLVFFTRSIAASRISVCFKVHIYRGIVFQRGGDRR